jgi:putative aldouronate transport system substrate-binding protein
VTDTGLWDWDELHTLLTEMKRRCPEQYPLVAHYGTMLSCIGQDSLGNDLGVLIDESTSDTTVVNLYATEQYRAFCERMHAWYQEGLILSDTYEGQMSGAVQVLNGMGMGFLQRAGEFGMSGEWTRIRLSEPTFDTYTNYVFWGVSAQSRQTERAVQLLQAIFRDPDIALLLLFGEESVDYELNEERVLQVTDSGWSGNKWAWPGWSSVLETVDLGEQRIVPEGTEVHYSPAYGFVCDMEPVSREAERCLAVVEKYNKGLLCGFLNPETEIPAFVQELQEAGIDTILAEKQRQLDQWLAQK